MSFRPICLPEDLKAARLEKGLTQIDVCARLEEYGIYVTQGALSKIENGQRSLSLDEALALIHILDKVSWFKVSRAEFEQWKADAKELAK